jgi:hypothetical protein
MREVSELRAIRVNREIKKRAAKIMLLALTGTPAEYPEIAAVAPGKVIKPNKIVQPSIIVPRTLKGAS